MRFPLAILTAVTLCASLISCGGSDEPDAPPASRPVKIFTVESIDNNTIRNFPGSIRASKRADLSFRVAGVIQTMAVKEGQVVKQGDLLAALDPTDFKLTLEDRQATFDKTERNMERAKELIVDGNISKMDYDRMEASFKTAKVALSQARQDLEYTEIPAPFDGSIGQREVENFEEVQAKQTIFRFQDNSQLDVLIDLPESLVRKLRLTKPTIGSNRPAARRDQVTAYARFEGRSDEQFALEVKEVATQADSKTQTFRVTMTMPAPPDFSVFSGMTATVSIDFANVMTTDTATWVPSTAVQADNGLEARVWVLDATTMTVSSLPVEIGRLSGHRIEVKTGLRGGEDIVSVGAAYLAEGMKVTRMKQTEQAIPRTGESS